MLKIIFASAAILAAPNAAKAMDPAQSLQNLITIEVARTFCGLRPTDEMIMRNLDRVMPYTNMTANQVGQRVGIAAIELGMKYRADGILPSFCEGMAKLYSEL